MPGSHHDRLNLATGPLFRVVRCVPLREAQLVDIVRGLAPGAAEVPLGCTSTLVEGTGAQARGARRARRRVWPLNEVCRNVHAHLGGVVLQFRTPSWLPCDIQEDSMPHVGSVTQGRREVPVDLSGMSWERRPSTAKLDGVRTLVRLCFIVTACGDNATLVSDVA